MCVSFWCPYCLLSPAGCLLPKYDRIFMDYCCLLLLLCLRLFAQTLKRTTIQICTCVCVCIWYCYCYGYLVSWCVMISVTLGIFCHKGLLFAWQDMSEETLKTLRRNEQIYIFTVGSRSARRLFIIDFDTQLRNKFKFYVEL